MTDWNPWAPRDWSATELELQSPDLPFVTIGILSYNRKDDLRRMLDVVTRAVQYPSYEVLVIDNGSTDGSAEMVRAEFPSVRLHAIGWNMGIPARNIQAELAKGKYLFSYDDDSCPGTPATILRIVQFMEKHTDVDVLSSRCQRPLTGITETGGWEQFRLGMDSQKGYEGIFLVEGGVCFRLSSLRTMEGYDSRFLFGKEGFDLGLQFFKSGGGIYLCPRYVTLHFASNVMRSPNKILYLESRNALWLIAKHWPFSWTPLLTLAWVFRRMLGMILHRGTAMSAVKGLKDGFKGMGPFFQYRPKLTWSQALKLKRFYVQMVRW